MKEDVALLACGSYAFEEVKQAVDEQFRLLSLDGLLHDGMEVLVKPNLIMRSAPEAAAVTHPTVVAAVACWLREHGANVTIADSPGGVYNPTVLRAIYRGTGYQAMAEEYGFLLNTDCSYEEVKNPGGTLCHEFPIIAPALRAELIVDVAKLKTHCMTMLSGTVKNMFGAVPGLMKPELHCRFPQKPEFCEMLVDLCSMLRPSICVLDGVTAMEGNGPTGGRPRHVGVLLAGRNPFAVDCAGARLIGMDPASIPLLAAGMRRGLCPGEGDIRVLGGDPARFAVPDFLQPESKTSDFIDRLPRFLRPLASKVTTPIPKIRESACVGCGRCAESCPQHTITIENHVAKIHYQHCIRCYCCHEMCPMQAIDIKRFSLFRL